MKAHINPFKGLWYHSMLLLFGLQRETPPSILLERIPPHLGLGCEKRKLLGKKNLVFKIYDAYNVFSWDKI